MSAGRKAKSEKSPAHGQPGETSVQPASAAADKNASSPAKSDKPEKTGFAPGTYYRQGVLVPGGPHKGPMPRSRSR